MWRLSEYNMSSKSHTVYRLPVHLPQEQAVYFTPGREEEALERSHETKLTAWFKLNQHSTEANQYHYQEIPLHYTYQANKKVWSARKINTTKTIARMYAINPQAGEVFWLRTLLLHVPGATSFEYLRTVDGTVLPTFKDACLQLSLIEDDMQWDATLSEASLFQMPRQLRFLFATICIHCQPADPLTLWNNYQASLTEDFSRTHDSHAAAQLALADINTILMEFRFTTESFNLPPVQSPSPLCTVMESHSFDVLPFDALNPQQSAVIQAVLQAVDSPPDTYKAFFVDGPGGS